MSIEFIPGALFITFTDILARNSHQKLCELSIVIFSIINTKKKNSENKTKGIQKNKIPRFLEVNNLAQSHKASFGPSIVLSLSSKPMLLISS